MGSAISIIVPSVRSETIADTIAAIQAQSDTQWELIISDQSGTDTLEALIRSLGDPRIRRVPCRGRGASLARNVGILAANNDILAFTDDDCCPRTAWIATIRTLFAENPDLWMATGSIVPPATLPTGVPFVCPSYVPQERLIRPSEGGERLYSVTANAVYRRIAFEKAGPFDVCLSPGTEFCGGEEDDHGSRMELFDPYFLSTPRLEVEHTHGVRIGTNAAWRIKRNYAFSVGGVAGKRTLMGDDDGKRMVRSEILSPLSTGNPLRIARGFTRAVYVWQGYQTMLRGYTVDRLRHLLIPRDSTMELLYDQIAPLLNYRLPSRSVPVAQVLKR